MAVPKRQAKKAVGKAPVNVDRLRPEEKIARMLGIIALQTVKGRPEQAWMLRTGGFSNAEIAEMLDTSDNGVSVLLYKAKQKRASKLNGAD